MNIWRYLTFSILANILESNEMALRRSTLLTDIRYQVQNFEAFDHSYCDQLLGMALDSAVQVLWIRKDFMNLVLDLWYILRLRVGIWR